MLFALNKLYELSLLAFVCQAITYLQRISMYQLIYHTLTLFCLAKQYTSFRNY